MSKFYLKDWHGKEKEFTDEKIFVRGEKGELIQFTQGEGDKPAVVQPLEVTENGTYTAPDGVDGYSPVTVNVASSGGGGGLPTGVYWEMLPKPTGYGYGTFQYKGKLYMAVKQATGDNYYDFYLFENGEYTEVASDIWYYSPTYVSFVEYKGILHLLGCDNKMHYTWDGGSTKQQLASLPELTAGNCAFILDDNLYILTKAKGFYKWVEDSDTWEAVSVQNVPTTSGYATVVVQGRYLYILKSGNMYKVDWDAKSCTTIRTGLGIANTAVFQDGWLYFVEYTAGFPLGLYRYNISTDVVEKFSSVPSNLLALYVYNNRLHINGVYTNTFGIHMAMHIVTE